MTSAARIGSRRARRRDAAATRDALLAAGTELFAERGYDGVPVWAIAQKAGVNKAMINYHFGGKRKLYRAIVSATFGEMVDQDRKSTRLNSSHSQISYAVFCLKKKKIKRKQSTQQL